MKEYFLNSKNKTVLISICEILNIKGLNKSPRDKIMKQLISFSYKELKEAYNGTNYGINRKRIESAISKYPNDIVAQLEMNK